MGEVGELKSKDNMCEDGLVAPPQPLSTKSDFMHHIIDLGQDATFFYNGNKAGICSRVENYIFSFELWYREKIKEYKNLDLETVMSDPFFDGKSINDLIDAVVFYFV